MPLDPRLPLQGIPADIPGAFQRGLRFREENRRFGENQRFSDIIQQQGQGAAAGDPGAIRAIAGVDPGLAQRLEQGALKNRAGNREKDLFEAKRALAIMSRIRTPEEWDRIAAKLAPDLVGQFDKREQIMAGIRDTILALGDDEKSALFQRAVDGGLTPGTPAFQQFMLRGGKPTGGAGRRPSSFAEKRAFLQNLDLSDERVVELLFSKGGDTIINTGDFAGGEPSEPNVAPARHLSNQNVDVTESLAVPGMLSRLANIVFDGVGAGLVDEAAEEARIALNDLELQTTIGAQDAVPGRPSKFLLEMLGDFSVTPNSLLQGKGGALLRLKKTRDTLQFGVDENRAIANARGVSKDDVSKAVMGVIRLNNLIEAYDRIIDGFGKGGEGGGEETGTIDLRNEGAGSANPAVDAALRKHGVIQ